MRNNKLSLPKQLYLLAFCLITAVGCVYITDVLAVEKRVALVIGNADYMYASPLGNSVNDANDMTGALNRLGFSVHTVLDGDQASMLTAIDDFERDMRGADISLFFYAGHGIQYEGRNYLAPKDINLSGSASLVNGAVDASKVVQAMGNATSKANIIVLDACRNNPLGRGLARKRSNERSNEGLAPMESVSGTLISFATQPGNTASDGPRRNGLYTEQLLRFIEKPKLDIVQMFNQVSFAVQKENKRQQPWIHFSAIPPLCLAGCDETGSQLATVPTNKAEDLVPETKVVKAGSFLMGDAEGDGDPDEQPAHEVQVSKFSVGKFEVTVGQFKKFVEDTNYTTDAERQGGCWEWTGQLPWRENPQINWQSPGFSQRDDSPVVCVSWQDANRYLQWLSEKTGSSYRLPTEAEWEYVARAGSTTSYLTGSNINQGVAHCATCPGSQYGSGPAPVGSFKANRFGLYDMQGNVWEWVEDSYATYDGGVHKPNRKVARGGSWTDIPDTLRLSGRIHFNTSQAMVNLGLRVVRE